MSDSFVSYLKHIINSQNLCAIFSPPLRSCQATYWSIFMIQNEIFPLILFQHNLSLAIDTDSRINYFNRKNIKKFDCVVKLKRISHLITYEFCALLVSHSHRDISFSVSSFFKNSLLTNRNGKINFYTFFFFIRSIWKHWILNKDSTFAKYFT